MVVKGRRRDSAWFSVLDDEWEGCVGFALEKWLAEGNFDEEGKQKRKLEDIRRGVQLKRIEFEADRVRGKG